jgi:hypothetical protein
MSANPVCSHRLKSLKPILRKWIRLNKTLLKEWRKENAAPWWFNERASVSLFAGAVWKCKGWAFEEYVGPKQSQQKTTSGRVDLEFSLKKSRYIAEAKQLWLPSTRKQEHCERIQAAKNNAKTDVRRSSYGLPRLAIVFAVPYLSKIDESSLAEKTKKLINGVLDLKPKPDAVAWYFPDASEAPLYVHKKKSLIYPGVFVLIWQV